MTVTDFGVFAPYTPDHPNPIGIAWMRNQEGRDWYEIAHSPDHPAGVWLMAGVTDGRVVSAASEPGMLRPVAGHRVVLLEGSGLTPEACLGRCLQGDALVTLPPPIVPVTRTQALLALLEYGGTPITEAQIASYIETIEDPIERERSRILLGAATWRRDEPRIASFGGAFGFSAAQIDDLFRLAATL